VTIHLGITDFARLAFPLIPRGKLKIADESPMREIA
jgi:hypothetical protein